MWIKLAYVVVWYGGGVLLVNVVLGGFSDWVTVGALFLWDTSVLVVGVRAFRGKSEPVAAPRAWWRMTGGTRSASVLGALGVLNALLTLPLQLAAGSPLVVNTCWLGLVGLAYLHSAIRARRIPAA